MNRYQKLDHFYCPVTRHFQEDSVNRRVGIFSEFRDFGRNRFPRTRRGVSYFSLGRRSTLSSAREDGSGHFSVRINSFGRGAVYSKYRLSYLSLPSEHMYLSKARMRSYSGCTECWVGSVGSGFPKKGEVPSRTYVRYDDGTQPLDTHRSGNSRRTPKVWFT